ncbi:hypothetical protein [Algoriphagus aquimarinus]|uniref:CMP/dCMP-type deaminase domain-containing protein n=1 Tax=Algoriphagus aquimarinus TaxID=237018 RepID=A0A5C7ATV6_9BACT|nr:hypothetical protein [Algoriphagus aquimarinus]TXE12150.1 hypothetical protein ESV85_08880 [Algoriphagus aquimarinus]
MKKSKVEKIYKLRSKFSIIGLTGRTGAGVTKVAEFLSSDFSTIQNIQPLKLEPLINKTRRYNISYTYAKENWKKYTVIKYKNVILLHLLRSDSSNMNVSLLELKFPVVCVEEIFDLIKGCTELITRIKEISSINETLKDKDELKQLSEIFFSKEFNDFSNRFDEILNGYNLLNRIKFFHNLANNLRKSGDCFNHKDEDEISIFTIAETINRIIKGYKISHDETHITIDSLRNSIEIMFFKERYSAFYMISINSEHRREFLLNKYQDDINFVDRLMVFEKDEYEGEEVSKGNFYVQDVRNCIQKSDIYFNYNPPFEEREAELPVNELIDRSDYYLVGQIIKYTSLILHPGLITPSAQERCMQIAYVAKANSGCISRQVGAAITDVHFSIKSIGWNDVPTNSTPCLLRSTTNLVNKKDPESFSPFEKEDKYGFNQELVSYYKDVDVSALGGQNCSFCFKDFYNTVKGKDNQVHTRSLHAEENAMLQISKNGGVSLKNGILFTTASPCELCAKKARQLEICQIYYIDPYPGISRWHILRDGSSLPDLILFSGAVGRAYHKLYDPVMSYKDELALITNKRPKSDLVLSGM